MEKKILFGTLAGAITGSIAAMAIFMGLLGSMAEKWYAENAACVKAMDEAPMWAMIVASLVQGLFISILLHRFNISTFKSGFIAGGWITLFMALWFGLYTHSTFNAYPLSWLPIDVIGNTICGALAGGVIGWIYGKVK